MSRPPDRLGAPLIGPVQLGDAHNPLNPPRRTSLPPGERDVWERALQFLRPRYTALYFQVRVGGHVTFTAGLSDDMIRDALALSAHRIDVVGDARTHWELIEVKDRASLSAVGQLIGYQILWRRGPPDDRDTRLVSVAPNTTPPVSHVLSALNIEAVIG